MEDALKNTSILKIWKGTLHYIKTLNLNVTCALKALKRTGYSNDTQLYIEVPTTTFVQDAIQASSTITNYTDRES